MGRLGLNSALQSDGQPSSHSQPRPLTRSSLTERDTRSFSDFKQRWMSERSPSQANQFDKKNGLGLLRLQRSEESPWLNRGRSQQTGVDSALSRLREFRKQRESKAGSQTESWTGHGQSSRSNLGLTYRIAKSPFGADQPMFQRHRTDGSQIREIKQIARDGSIFTKMCHTSDFRQDKSFITRSRAGSGSSTIHNESVARMRQKMTTETDEPMKLRDENENEKKNEKSDADDLPISLASRLRRQRILRGDKSLEQQTPVEQKLLQAKKIMGRSAEGSLKKEKPAEASLVVEQLKEDVKEAASIKGDSSEQEIPKAGQVDAGNCEGAVSSSKIEAETTERLTNCTPDNNDDIDNKLLQEGKVKDESETESEETSKLHGHSFERSRMIASRIFEKLETKKSIVKTTKVGGQCEMGSNCCMGRKCRMGSTPDDDLEEKSEQGHGYEERKSVLKQKLKRDSFEVKVTKTKPINIHGFHYKDSITEVKEIRSSESEGLATESISVKQIGAVLLTGLKESRTKLTPPEVPHKRPPVVGPKPSPPVSPLPPHEKPVVLGSAQKIRVAVQLPDEERCNEEGETDERGESSVEEPTQQSVATLRNSLFGGSSSSLENMLSRGMGGTLSASPVVLRKKQVTERRQVVSNVEVTKNGVASMSTTHTFRMERRSESDATRNAEEAGLLPTLYTRFEKPKKPGVAPRTRKSALEPITLSVKLSDDDND